MLGTRCCAFGNGGDGRCAVIAVVTSLPNKRSELMQLAIQSGRGDFARLEANEEPSAVRDQEDFGNLAPSNPAESPPASYNGASEGSQSQTAAQGHEPSPAKFAPRLKN